MATITEPGAELVGQFVEGTPEWQAAREGAITGSRIAAVLGLSPWESPFSLWHRMAGLAPAQPVNDLMHWGTKLEPLILDEYALRRSVDGCLLHRKPGVYRHPQRHWQMVSPDAINGDRIVEAKYSPQTDGWGDEGTEQIPVYYRAQVLWQLDVFGYREADVCVWFGNCAEYREYTITYDPSDIAVMRERARSFLDTLTNGARPDIDGHDATYQVVREMHPDIDDVAVDLPPTVGRQYLDALDTFEQAGEAKLAAVSQVLDAMGRGRRAYLDGKQIAMRIPGRGDHPPFLRPTPTKPTGQKVRNTP